MTGEIDVRKTRLSVMPKPSRNQALLDAIRQAIERDRTKRQERAEREELGRRLDSLTPRQRQVMGLVVP